MTKEELIRRNTQWAQSVLQATRYASTHDDTEVYDDLVEVAEALIQSVQQLLGR